MDLLCFAFLSPVPRYLFSSDKLAGDSVSQWACWLSDLWNGIAQPFWHLCPSPGCASVSPVPGASRGGGGGCDAAWQEPFAADTPTPGHVRSSQAAPFGTWRGVDMAVGINPPKAHGELGTRAAGEVQSTAAKYNCTALAEQERMMLAASRTSPWWFFSTLHVRHIGNIGCFFLTEQNNENTWKKSSYAGQGSLIKESCVFRCLPLFPLLFNSRETRALSHINSRAFSFWKSY